MRSHFTRIEMNRKLAMGRRQRGLHFRRVPSAINSPSHPFLEEGLSRHDRTDLRETLRSEDWHALRQSRWHVENPRRPDRLPDPRRRHRRRCRRRAGHHRLCRSRCSTRRSRRPTAANARSPGSTSMPAMSPGRCIIPRSRTSRSARLSEEEQRKLYLPDDTLKAFEYYSLGLKGPLTTPIGGGFRQHQRLPADSSSICMPACGR